MIRNKQCAAYCITVIRCLLQEKAVPEIPEGVSLAELYDFSKLHSVEAMVFHGLEQLDPDRKDPVWQKWQNRADMLLTQSIVQLAERDRIFSAMHCAGIPLLPVKGSWLKELYPQIDYRQMSDLDMLIHPENAKKAESVMLRLGYTHGEETSDHHHSYSMKPYMELEMHLSLLPDTNAHSDYYDNIWKRAELSEYPGVYRLSPEDEYIYYLLHLQHHVQFAGSGIRSFLDSVIYRALYPERNTDYLLQEYKKLGIASFVREIEALSDCWFVTGDSPAQDLEALQQSVISAGTYGTEEQQFRRQMQAVSTARGNAPATPLTYWLSRLFLPAEEMGKEYPILKKLPFLLPVFWMIRLLSKLTKHPKALLRHIKLVNEIGKTNGKD